MGGGIHPPPGFSLAIATKINRSTPNFLTFNFYYRDIIWAKIKFITCQGVTSSLFCRKHLVSPHIFHCIFTEFSCSTFSFFWHLYLVLISVFWWKNILLVIFLWKHWNLTKKFDDVSTFEKTRNFDYFSDFCSPEFHCLVRDLAIFPLKCKEKYSSIPKSKNNH